jgi:branched-chain amino acid transport system substrate-binding protein
MGSRRKLWSGVGAVTVVVAVAACSSSAKSSSSSTSAASSAPTSAQATAAPIKVGLICDCSGAVGSILLPEAEVYQAWVKYVNASGGINGHSIQLTVEDDQSIPATSASDAQTLVADHVDAIADDSIFDETWASTVKAANIPVVGEDASETPMYSNSDFYPQAQTNDSSIPAVIATAKAAGATNLAAFYCAEAPSCMELLSALKTDGAKAGVPVVLTEEIALSAPNFTAQCVAAQQAHISAVAVFDASPPIARVGEDCNRQGYNPIYVTEGEGTYPVLLTAPGIKNNLSSEYNDLPYWANTPSVQTMNSVVDKYYPGLRSNPNVWNQGAAEGWPSGLLLEDAVKAGGLTPSATPSAAEIVTGLESLKGDTLQGWAPPLTFAAGQDHSIDCWFTTHTSNGVSSLTNGGKVTCEQGSSS